MSKYLKRDPLPLLLQSPSPLLRFRASRDLGLCDIPGNGDSSAPSELVESLPVKYILSASKNGILGDSSHPDIYYRGTLWTFAVCVIFGLTMAHPLIESTAQYIISRKQMDCGALTPDCSPPIPDACMTGNMLHYLLVAGFEGPEIERGIGWILDHQRPDGGWISTPVSSLWQLARFLLWKKSGAISVNERNDSTASCVYATAACASAMASFYRKDSRITESLSRAADFFLSHNLFCGQPDSGNAAFPRSGRNKNFSMIGFPVFCQYDIMKGLEIVTAAGKLHEPGAGEAFNSLVQQQTDFGTIQPHNFGTGMLFHDCCFRKFREDPDLWTTLRFLILLKNANHYTHDSTR